MGYLGAARAAVMRGCDGFGCVGEIVALVAIVMADPSHGMRLLILFVAALGRQIEPVVDAHHGLQSTSVGGIRMKDVAVGILVKDAGAGRFFSGEKLDFVVVIHFLRSHFVLGEGNVVIAVEIADRKSVV